jgi:surface antigen
MKNFRLSALFLIAVGMALSSCSTHLSTSQPEPGSKSQMALLSGTPVNGGPVAGSGGGMDDLDRSKLYHALDAGIGKASSWDNVATGTEYTVVPIQKLTVNGNPYCRKYSITSVRSGNSHQTTGTACVSTDGGWHPA